MELRILKKKDGTEVLQFRMYFQKASEIDGSPTWARTDWQDVPTVTEE